MIYQFVLLFILNLFFQTNSQLTNFVDKDSKLIGFAEKNWFKHNIPFIEVPDKTIEDIYYYRWATHKRHLRYLHPGVGYSVTEFVHNVNYAPKFGVLVDAAGHHIYESRWLRDQKYVKDYINFYARDNDDYGNHQYTEWVADSAYKSYLMNADKRFIVSQLEGLVRMYDRWNNHFEPKLGLYFVSPLWDAQEFSAASVQTKDKFAGGVGYRPSHNSHMYGNAIAIINIAKLAGNTKVENDFKQRAEALRKSIITHLWDKSRNFFYHMQRDNNPNNALLDTREEIGFYPFRFEVPDNSHNFSVIWAELFDPHGFDSKYGPTTCEMRSKWYIGDQKPPTCCWWNGNSWPYSTCHVLSSLATQLRKYKSNTLTAESYHALLHKYAITQYKNGKPYVAECHSPGENYWVGDSRNHSEHYAHSTYNDNVLYELLGIIPRADDKLDIDPIVPKEWNYFIAENILYHGHNITVLYDKMGDRYKVGTGMKVYLNGKQVANQTNVGKLVIDIPVPHIIESHGKRIENYAANVRRTGYPKPSASFTHPSADLYQAIDGRIFYDYIPSNRWFNFDSKHDTDWFAVDFGREKTVNTVSVYVYDDVVTKEGTTECPTDMTVQYNDGREWKNVEKQVHTPVQCSGNDLNKISFTSVNTKQIRVVFTRNTAKNHYIGITELEVWGEWPQTPNENIYEAEDGVLINAMMESSTSASGHSYVGMIDTKDSSVQFSGVRVTKDGNYKIRVYYANNDAPIAKQNVFVNNLHELVVNYAHTMSGWGHFDNKSFVDITVPLITGDNILIFKHSIGFAELDKIELLV